MASGWMGLDIGPDAIKQFQEALKDAKVTMLVCWDTFWVM